MTPPSDSSHSPFQNKPRPFSLLRMLSLLLLGVGLGTLGTLWFTSKADSSDAVGSGRTLLNALRPSQAQADVPSATVPSATVCVKTPKGWNELACASGVSIAPQLAGIDPGQGAVVLTNYHVIANMGNRPPVQLGGKGEIFNAEIIRQSPEYDLALLFVPRAQFPVAALAEASPGQGTAVRAIGFPNDQPLTIKDSTLLGTTQNCLAVAPCLTLRQGTITFGNSGGPLEADGRVVGITQGEIEDEVVIPVEQVRQFLSGQPPSSANRQSQFDPGFPPMQNQPIQEPHYYPPVEGLPPFYPTW